jgi:hypothetical protein
MKLSGKCLLVFVVVATTIFASGCSKGRVKSAQGTQGAASSQPSTEGKPKIVALETEHNFGKVKEGTTLEHVFRIRNQGDQELVIERASGS